MECDREMLMLAAKAAGIAIKPCTCSDAKWPFKHDESVSGKRGHWNPLEDDGDALRLAVKLSFLVDVRGGDKTFVFKDVSPPARVSDLHGTDPMAATRRAIVRAAAEIGRDAKEDGNA